MKRQRPKVTDAQSQSMAEYSKLQAKFEARVLDELGRDLEDHFHAAGVEYRKHLVSLESAEYWFPRIAVVPVALLAIVFLFFTLYGLWSGEFPTFSR